MNSDAGSRRPPRLFRIASLLVPSAAAWGIASAALHDSPLAAAVVHVLAPLWLATAGGVSVRAFDLHARRARLPRGVRVTDAFDLLTATGTAVAWTGAGAVLAAATLGWPSLSLVGLFGLSVLHFVALATLVAAGGADPLRSEGIGRSFTPPSPVEGESVTEEVTMVAPRIPAGFRLLACGRVGARWPTSRYAVEASESGGELVLRSDLGPARRGYHESEPLTVWLQDVLGLCHSHRLRVGTARLTALPRVARLHVRGLLPGEAGHDRPPETAQRLPTEGALNLRLYQPGDDVRRIHWLRSASAGATFVRLPDERAPERPEVRLLLDTFAPGLAAERDRLMCDGPRELLDGLVRVWLGVARSLAQQGTRVALVTATRVDGQPLARTLRFTPRAAAEARRLGALARWQADLPVRELLGKGPSVVVSPRFPLDDAEGAARWVVVPGALWASVPPSLDAPPALCLPYPLGSADNRAARRKEVRNALRRVRADDAAFRVMTDASKGRRAGHWIARPRAADEVSLEVQS